MLEDILICALDLNIPAWITDVAFHSSGYLTAQEAICAGASVFVTDVDGNRSIIDFHRVAEGLIALCEHVGVFRVEGILLDYDHLTADLLLQFSLYQEIIYPLQATGGG